FAISSQGSSIHSSRYALSKRHSLGTSATCLRCSADGGSPIVASVTLADRSARLLANSIAYVHTPPIASAVIRMESSRGGRSRCSPGGLFLRQRGALSRVTGALQLRQTKRAALLYIAERGVVIEVI